ncbi:MAG: DUF177 domain-containing protein [Prevotella sp.]|nr:DUF177 domain-containing protein [Prevotella sp.]
MSDLESFKIDLKNLNEENTRFNFNLDDSFFEAIGGCEVNSGKISVALNVHKGSSFFELCFHLEGIVNIPCDICLDMMEQPVCADNQLTVKLGEEYSEDGDYITVEKNDGTLDVSWPIYEFVALSIPIKHVHEQGKCNKEMLKILEEHSAAHGDNSKEKAERDTRWRELEKLKNIIKD